MKELDFTGINKIAYNGFEDAEARDSLLEAGYTVVQAPENPFAAPPPPPIPERASRNYKKIYRAAHDFHQRHNPPTVERSYWKDHKPGTDEPPEAELRYWDEITRDIAQTSTVGGDDPFLIGLLTAVFEELEREYKLLRDEAAAGIIRSA